MPVMLVFAPTTHSISSSHQRTGTITPPLQLRRSEDTTRLPSIDFPFLVVLRTYLPKRWIHTAASPPAASASPRPIRQCAHHLIRRLELIAIAIARACRMKTLVFQFPLALALLLLVTLHAGVGAQLTITVTTLNAQSGDGTPNTFIGTGNQIASSLLGSGTPAFLWGVVSSGDVNSVCTQIVNTGSLSFDATLDAAGGTQSLTMQVTAIGGCLAASDGSGTQAVLLDNTGRQSAVVCPDNAGSTGCGVYLTGDDVDALYNSGARRRLMSARKLLDDCQGEAIKGAVGGAVTGILGAGECLALGPLAPFCILGVLGVSAGLGAAAGCAGDAAASCFPGDATVSLASGEVKRMTALALGDKVAVRTNGAGQVAYEDVYAFGHKDAMALSEFVQLTLKPAGANVSDQLSVESRTLELSALHFAPVVSAGNAGKTTYKRGGDIAVGDQMLAQGASTMYVVSDVSKVEKAGLYNPFTLGGTIIVNGVVASSHSDWFLDTTFESLGLTHWLPAAYQMVLSPVRLLYRILGKDLYISVYHRLDAVVDIAAFGTSHGASIAATVAASSAVIAALLLSNASVLSNSRGQKC